MNTEKTEMVSRKNGKVKQGERINYGQERLRVVKCYEYLGITLQTSGKTFNLHTGESGVRNTRYGSHSEPKTLDVKS
jgi:hypothetical protein